ncbi:MAG: hypothetical protein J0L92_32435 [Deltaproteobacteria bacterium]|nr:hypothetical protein [Deltaproteobacteria bacterium]
MHDPNAPFGQPPASPPGQAPLALPPSGFTPDPAPYQRDEDYFGWIGLGLGVVSWLMCCCSIIPFVGLITNVLAFVMALAAIILGALSFRNARRGGQDAVLGIAAMVLGGARFGLVVVAIILVVVALLLGVGGGMLSALTQGMH